MCVCVCVCNTGWCGLSETLLCETLLRLHEIFMVCEVVKIYHSYNG